MRRALLEILPSLSAEFGIMPHHLDHMTPREVSEYVTQLHQARMNQED